MRLQRVLKFLSGQLDAETKNEAMILSCKDNIWGMMGMTRLKRASMGYNSEERTMG